MKKAQILEMFLTWLGLMLELIVTIFIIPWASSVIDHFWWNAWTREESIPIFNDSFFVTVIFILSPAFSISSSLSKIVIPVYVIITGR
jgi:hypothetical protein